MFRWLGFGPIFTEEMSVWNIFYKFRLNNDLLNKFMLEIDIDCMNYFTFSIFGVHEICLPGGGGGGDKSKKARVAR